MQPVRLILVGGFLGSGKTTLLAEAAARLVRGGKRVGLITNDQAADLVDTEILRRAGFGVQEISGGCFCCRFESLVESAEALIEEHRPDVLIGEPVGSCTDISATVLQPLKDRYADRFRLAPFSVLVDPVRVREALRLDTEGRLPESVYYVFRKQLEEADLVVINKTDLVSGDDLRQLQAGLAERFPPTPMLSISALNGDGVDEWLEAIGRDRRAGRRVAQVDYDTYAEGEAVLGWLNASIRLRSEGGTDWAALCADLLAAIQRQCADRSAEIAHVKLFLKAPGGYLQGNLTSGDAEPFLRGSLEDNPAEVTLLLNARVNTDPHALRTMVETALDAVADDAVAVTIDRLEHFSPARPEPVHRYDTVV